MSDTEARLDRQLTMASGEAAEVSTLLRLSTLHRGRPPSPEEEVRPQLPPLSLGGGRAQRLASAVKLPPGLTSSRQGKGMGFS